MVLTVGFVEPYNLLGTSKVRFDPFATGGIRIFIYIYIYMYRERE